MTTHALQSGTWLYMSAFKSGQLHVFDLTAGKVVRSIAVEDSAGIIGVAVSSDGRKVFIVDGDHDHRLRVFRAATGERLSERPFTDRALNLSGSPVMHLSADDRWLFLKTYDYGAAAAGLRVFNVDRQRFAPLGLRGRPCRIHALAGASDGSLMAGLPQLIQAFSPLPPTRGDLLFGGRVSMPIQSWTDLALSRDGHPLYVLGVPNSVSWPLVSWQRGA